MPEPDPLHPKGVPPPGLKAVFQLLFREANPKWPKWVENTHPLNLPRQLESGQIALTFINHASFLLQGADGNLLLDPVFGKRASPVSFAGPKRVRAALPSLEQLPPIKLVLVTHNHYDHMDLPSLRQVARRFDPLFVSGRGNAAYLRRVGIQKIQELDWWQAAQGLPLPGLELSYAPTVHFSARGLRDRSKALWGAFYLRWQGKKIYFAGDTAYGGHFSETRQRLGAPDLALLPIGAYTPRWFFRGFHCDPADAVQAHIDLQAQQSIAMHFGTFKLTMEAYHQPVEELKQALLQMGVEQDKFRVLEHGETIFLK